MPDSFAVRTGTFEPVPAPDPNGNPRTIYVMPHSADVYYKNLPSFSPAEGTKIEATQSASVSERVWLTSSTSGAAGQNQDAYVVVGP